MKDYTFNAIKEALENDNDLLIELCESLDSYNGFLGDDRYYEMDELPELFYGTDIMDLLYMVFYGCDETYETKSEFNPNRNYFTFNGYGNLVSNDYRDYDVFLDDAIYEIENVPTVYLPTEIAALYTELEND